MLPCIRPSAVAFYGRERYSRLAGARAQEAGVRLERVEEGVFAVPESLPKGLYFIRIGTETLLRHLF